MANLELTVLLYEAILRNSSGLERLLNKGARPNLILAEYGASAFHVAVGIGPESYGFHATKLFLQHGGDPNVRSVEGLTPVHVAAMWGKLAILYMLLVHGGDPWLLDEDGMNAFQLAEDNALNLLTMFSASSGKSADIRKDTTTLDKVILDSLNVSTECGDCVSPPQVLQTRSAGTQTSYFTCSLSVRSQETQEGSSQSDTGAVGAGGDLAKHSSCEPTNITSPSEGSRDCHGYQHFLLELKNILTFRQDTGVMKVADNCDQVGSNGTLVRSGIANEAIGDTSREVLSERKSEIRSCVVTEDAKRSRSRDKSFVSTNLSSEEDMFGSLLTDDLSSVRECTNELNEDGTCGMCELMTSDEDGPHISDSAASSERATTRDLCRSSVEREQLLVAVCEEYKYTDDEGVSLVEQVFMVQPGSLPHPPDAEDQRSCSQAADQPPPDVSTSSAASCPLNVDYDSDTLRNDLKQLGQNIGPVTPTTKRVYLKRLFSLHKHMSLPPPTGLLRREYSTELQQSLDNMDRLASYAVLERTVAEQFSAPDHALRWREGVLKTSFTYLLLDPRISRNLPCRSEGMSQRETWSTFLAAVFYVGKGRRSRPYAHLYEAVAAWKKPRPHSSSNGKVRHILDVWRTGAGVVCLHVFQTVIPVEAFTREAAMIDAMGMNNLRNSRRGEYYGVAGTWSQNKQRQLGASLLFRAMQVFLIEGERQLRPHDI